ncbi:MAG TPA: alanine racemase [Longilinea sp.]|nr:alanine racemase [Longilinea sp.]
MDEYPWIKKPTLLLDPARARHNIHQMVTKAQGQSVRLRPHFKTHQSAQVGEFFREEGVTAITVSSVDMAVYFVRHGWNDILIAFPVNVREIGEINALAQSVHLGLLVESTETASFLGRNLKVPVDVWIKVDVGHHRTGLAWDDAAAAISVCQAVEGQATLRLRGLLTHGGQSYAAGSVDTVQKVYAECVGRLKSLRQELQRNGIAGLELSPGDTPGCVASDDLGGVDEIRPGNFVFFDAMQLKAGICRPEEIAVALACPVVALHPERGEVVIYGGAIHFSKDSFMEDGKPCYGYVALPERSGWGQPLKDARVVRLSQEHGIAHVSSGDLQHLKIGDLLCILPAHSCLTVTAMGEYYTPDGTRISTMVKE